VSRLVGHSRARSCSRRRALADRSVLGISGDVCARWAGLERLRGSRRSPRASAAHVARLHAYM
jgi:hypothetical protein